MARIMDHLEDGELETSAEESVQGAPLLPSQSPTAGRAWASRRGVAAAALLLGVGISALALGRLTASEEPGASPAALPAAGLQARLQLLEETPAPSEEPPAPSAAAAESGYDSTKQAFEAQYNKSAADFNASDLVAYEQYKQKVAADQEKMKEEGGATASAMAAAVEKAQSASQTPVQHTPMDLGGPVPPKMGRVAELYTYGAPGTAIDPLYDATQPDGCIKGLRIYTMGIRFAVGVGNAFKVYDPVAWICNMVGLKHSHMESLEAMQSNDNVNRVTKCGQGYTEPKADGFFWITGHLVYPKITNWHYEAIPSTVSNGVAPNDLSLRRLQTDEVTKEKVEKATLYAHFTFMNYKETPMISVDAPSWGWNLVGRACAASNVGPFPGVLGLQLGPDSQMQGTTNSFVDSCGDHVMLYQHNNSLECSFVFEGSDDLLDWMANLDFSTTPFCGLGYVHAGFRAKVLRMVGGVDYAQVIRPKLRHCSKVTVAGHSLGGAQAEIFTACANRMLEVGEPGYGEYHLVSFPKGTPKQLPNFHAEHAHGVYLRNKGTGMCMDVKGTLSTDYTSPIILFWCEFPNAGFSQDQKWDFKANGLIVNHRSQKCMASALDGNELVQKTCEATDTNQLWEQTMEHFLKNKGSGLCVDGSLTMITCPYTDQMWKMKANGQIVNQLSGLCMDIAENQMHKGSTEAGDDIVLGECDISEGTDQYWELNAEGALVNKKTGLCMNLKPEEGREDRPTMFLGKCNMQPPSFTMFWELSPTGFFRNRRNGKCLDVKGMPGMAAGSFLDINACEDKSVNVAGKWIFMPGGFIRNIGKDENQQYKCIMVSGEPWDTNVKNADGTKLRLNPCKTNTDQKWEITSQGFIRNTIGGQKCLDLVPPNVRPGGKLWLMNCADWNDNQLYLDLKFRFGNVRVHNKLYQTCIGVSSTSTIGEVHLMNCHEARLQTSQEGRGPWIARPDGAIQTGSQCLDVGTPVLLGAPKPAVLRPCIQGSLTGTTQEWDVMDNGFIHNRYHSFCLRPKSYGELGVKYGLHLVPCPTTTQLWELLPSGQIKNRLSGKCVDAMRNVTGTSWWDLTEWDCNENRKEQQWEQVA